MKNVIFTLIAIVCFNFVNANNYTSETIVIDGEKNRVEVLAILVNDYLEAQGKFVDIRKYYSIGHNDPTGRTLGTTDGTWIMISHPSSGTMELVQMSSQMYASIVAILKNPTSNIPSGAVINNLCKPQKFFTKLVANKVTPAQVVTTTTTSNTTCNTCPQPQVIVIQQPAPVVQAPVITEGPAPEIKTGYVEKESAPCGYKRNGRPRNCNKTSALEWVNLGLNVLNTVASIDTNIRVRKFGKTNSRIVGDYNRVRSPRAPRRW